MSQLVIGHESGCWLFVGVGNRRGYGAFSLGSGNIGVHRAAYLLLVGNIPPGHQMHHICENKLCCNPRHLRPVTPREHTHISPGPVGDNARKTHCVNGHEFTPENVMDSPGRRRCRVCHIANSKATVTRKRERMAAA